MSEHRNPLVLLKYAIVLMPRSAKLFATAVARRFGFAFHRWPSTRFDAMGDALDLLHANGFRPDVVIDVGANVGLWTATARARFPDATYHLVEPQPACIKRLKAIAEQTPRTHVYGTAITRPGVETVLMAREAGGPEDGGGTFVVNSPASALGAIPFPSTTLDSLFAGAGGTRVLLKLDVEGHELQALEGASALLARTEVVVAEFWMFRFWNEPMTILPDLIASLDAHGFAFYDVAALQGRQRDRRLVSGDAIFVRRGSALLADADW